MEWSNSLASVSNPANNSLHGCARFIVVPISSFLAAYKDRAVVAGESTFKWVENRATEMFKPTENNDILGNALIIHFVQGEV